MINPTVKSGKMAVLSIFPISPKVNFEKHYAGICNSIKSYLTPQKSKSCTFTTTADTVSCPCFDVYDKFFHTKDGLEGKRYRIGALTVKFLEKDIDAGIFVNLFNKNNVCIVNFNIDISGMSAQDVIALRHEIDSPEGSCTPQLQEVFKCIYEHLGIQKSKCRFKRIPKKHEFIKGISACAPCFNQQIIIELQEMGTPFGISMENDAHQWVMANSQVVYGLLTGDEGIGFITDSLVRERLGVHWSSRCFTDVLAFGRNVMLINAKHTEDQGKRYMAFQDNWNKNYGYSKDSDRSLYFSRRPCIAGMDHGVLKAVERNMIIQYYYELIDNHHKQDSMELHMQRRNLLGFISLTESAIDEINELFGMIERASGTARKIESVRYKLNVQNDELDISYQTRNNTIILILTVMSIAIAIAALQTNDIIFKIPPPIWKMILAVLGGIASILLVIMLCVKVAVFRNRPAKR